MRRIIAALSLSLTLLATLAGTALADPATELPAAACNRGTDHARTVNNANSNSPTRAHGNHGCHVHLPWAAVK